MSETKLQENMKYKREELICRIEEVEDEFSLSDTQGLFTANELAEHDGWRYQKRHLSGKYLAKKIISGFLNTGCNEKIEILNIKNGKPEVVINGYLKDACAKSGIKNIMVSISHSKHFITAMAVFEYGVG